MNWLLVRWWRWAGTHQIIAGWAITALCFGVFGGGVVLGAQSRQPPPVIETAEARPAVVRSTAVRAVVLGRRGDLLLARTASGERLLIRMTARTQVRRNGGAIDPAAVRRGTRVLVLGRPAGVGTMVARAVVVRGQAWVAPAAPDPATPARPPGD